MSFNRNLITNDLDMQGHSITNLKPESHSQHPIKDYLSDGFRYFNTLDRKYYQYDKLENTFIVDSGNSEAIEMIDILQSEIDVIQSEITTLQEVDTEVLPKIADLITRVTTLENNYTALNLRVTALENPV